MGSVKRDFSVLSQTVDCMRSIRKLLLKDAGSFIRSMTDKVQGAEQS